MILVVGALGSGREAFARSLLAPGARVARGQAAQRAAGVPACACLLDAQGLALASDCAGEVCDDAALVPLADALARLDVVTMAEVGCGVVPVDPRERAWREAAGRLGCLLAARAACVVRMTCGVPQVIKGALPAPGAPAPEAGIPGALGGDPC